MKKMDRVFGATVLVLGILLTVLGLWCGWDQFIDYPERQTLMVEPVPAMFRNGSSAAFTILFLVLLGGLMAAWGIRVVKR